MSRMLKNCFFFLSHCFLLSKFPSAKCLFTFSKTVNMIWGTKKWREFFKSPPLDIKKGKLSADQEKESGKRDHMWFPLNFPGFGDHASPHLFLFTISVFHGGWQGAVGKGFEIRQTYPPASFLTLGEKKKKSLSSLHFKVFNFVLFFIW